MRSEQPAPPIPEETRREIFHAIVAAQDKKIPVAHSRDKVASLFKVSRKEIKAIEDEGIENEWPPL